MSVRRWNVAEAKAKLSEVLSQASREPQVIENRGREVAVVLSIQDYQDLKLPKREPRPSPFSRSPRDEFS
jgi:prevent-host-death family protein